MNKRNLELIFFGIIFFVFAVILFFLFKPFLSTLFLAATFAIVLYPFYEILLGFFKNKSLSSILTILISFIFILLPLAFIGEKAFFEAKTLYVRFATNNVKEFDVILSHIEKPIKSLYPNFSLEVDKYLEFALGWLTSNFKDLVFGTISVLVHLFLMIISIFFLLRDGEYFIKKITELSPMKDSYDEQIIKKVSLTVGSVIKGTILIALIQGFLVGLGLYIFSVPNSFLWGSVASLCAFVPGLGTSLIVIPSVVYLFLVKNTQYAIGLLVWGGLLVSTIDNMLGPYFFRKKTKIHPLLVLFSVLGGLSFFGPEGFIFGPVILSIFISFLNIYSDKISNIG